jgi:negative regulator of flagellin synthesis FlgM
MKINQSPDTPVALSSNAAALAKAGPAASTLAMTSATKSTQSAGVAVSVSTLARSLEASSSGAAPEIDKAKVAAVRAAISKGTYTVNPEVIADKLLSNAQEILTRSRG